MDDLSSLILASAPPERTEPVFLAGHPDARAVLAELEALQEQIAEALEAESDSLNAPDTAALEELAEEARARLAPYRIEVRLRGLSWGEDDALRAQHPPRRDAEGRVLPTDLTGVNTTTYTAALVEKCWLGPDITPEAKKHLLHGGGLSRGQLQRLGMVAADLTGRAVDVPNSLTSSTSRRSTGGA